MSDAQDQITTAQNALTAAQADLDNSGATDVNDQIVSSLVSALESAGYTVTAPEAAAPAEDTSEATE